MLDTIIYSKDGSGNLIKTITHIDSIETNQISNEISALQSQVDSFLAGSQSDEIVSAIENYNAQISFLEALS